MAKGDVSYDARVGILDRWIATTVDWARVPPFRVLGIDEIALTKGYHNFVAVITAQTETGALHVLAILSDRLKATVAAWLRAMPAARRDHLATVCTDMWQDLRTERLRAESSAVQAGELTREVEATRSNLRAVRARLEKIEAVLTQEERADDPGAGT